MSKNNSNQAESQSCSPFIPGGTYQESLSAGTAIKVTLAALCNNGDGFVPSTLTYDSSEISAYMDIANIYGTLTLMPGRGNPINTENPFIPAGSYQNSSGDIEIILSATCANDNGVATESFVTYSAHTAKQFKTIENLNGYLVILGSPSISLPTVSDSESDEEADEEADEDADDLEDEAEADGEADGVEGEEAAVEDEIGEEYGEAAAEEAAEDIAEAAAEETGEEAAEEEVVGDVAADTAAAALVF